MAVIEGTTRMVSNKTVEYRDVWKLVSGKVTQKREITTRIYTCVCSSRTNPATIGSGSRLQSTSMIPRDNEWGDYTEIWVSEGEWTDL